MLYISSTDTMDRIENIMYVCLCGHMTYMYVYNYASIFEIPPVVSGKQDLRGHACMS